MIEPADLEGVLKDEMSKHAGDQSIVMHVDQSVPTD
jgi:hypothetical protein